MCLSGGLSGRCYPDVGYPVGCQGVHPDEGYPGGYPDVGYPGPHSEVASPKRLPYLAPDPGRRLHLISFEILPYLTLSDLIGHFFMIHIFFCKI